MSQANAEQLMKLVEQTLKNSGNSDLSNYNLPTHPIAILTALQNGDCNAFGTEMAKGYFAASTANTILYGIELSLSDFINMADRKADEFEALKLYLDGISTYIIPSGSVRIND